MNKWVQYHHDFDYLLVLDFECTCEAKAKDQPNPQEIIEFPIVVIDLRGNEILTSNFHNYIKPSYFPKLS